MNYVYKNKTILEYLKSIGIDSDKKRIKMAGEILLLSMKKNISYEEAVELYLNNLNKEKPLKMEKKHIRGVIYKGENLKEYLKKNLANDLKTEEDINACYISIKKFLNKCHDNISTEEKINYYFKHQYNYFIYIHRYNHLSYKEIDLFEIIKRVLNIDETKKIYKIKKLIYLNYINLKKMNSELSDEKAIYFSLVYYLDPSKINEICNNKKSL